MSGWSDDERHRRKPKCAGTGDHCCDGRGNSIVQTDEGSSKSVVQQDIITESRQRNHFWGERITAGSGGDKATARGFRRWRGAVGMGGIPAFPKPCFDAHEALAD